MEEKVPQRLFFGTSLIRSEFACKLLVLGERVKVLLSYWMVLSTQPYINRIRAINTDRSGT